MRPETFRVVCDKEGCNEELCLGHRFTCHQKAQRRMREEGWYYDATQDLCPDCWPGIEAVVEGESEAVFVGGAFHDPKEGT